MMGLFRKRCDGRHHRWGRWGYDAVHPSQATIFHRSCKCGAIQRHNVKTGVVTIWTPDGVISGLLDEGLTRKIFEDLP